MVLTIFIPVFNNTLDGQPMQFGFLKFFLLFLVLLVVGVGAFIILKDVPVHQQQVTINIPADSASGQ